MTRNGPVAVGAVLVGLGVIMLTPSMPLGVSLAREATDLYIAVLRGPAPSSAPPPTTARSPGDDTLWPVPTFYDGCRWTGGPGSDPGTGSARQPCDPGTVAPDVHHDVVDWRSVIDVAGAVGMIALLGAGFGGGWWWLSRRRAKRRAQDERRAVQIRRWNTAAADLAQADAAVMAFEMDPESVFFTRPLLADVTEPASSAFYTAYSTAHGLHASVVPADDDAITAFVTAASDALRAFEEADANARCKAMRGIVGEGRTLSDAQQNRLAQARTLMAQACDTTASPQFAQVAYRKALALIEEVGVRPPDRLVATTMRAIDTTHRLALPSAG